MTSPAAATDLRTLLRRARVVPVLTVEDDQDAVPLAKALFDGGLWMLEITLRTRGALAALRRIAKALPDAVVGVGTVTRPEELAAAAEAGARFAVSPGLTPTLSAAGHRSSLPYLPAAATASEIMSAREAGFNVLKFFPAKAAGGTKALRAYAPVFPDVAFCPTGLLTQEDFRDYLALDNVLAVGGTWMMPKAAITARDWGAITAASRACLPT
jgi:2-dehydro-3-deoxyphosphogluconate aldolase/(4S)-4-hydroxy-2-oxoglutarate aldolase